MNKQTTQNNIPRHIVLFPDGNRRWAKEQGMDTMEGHRAGYEKLLSFCAWCKDREVKVITAFGFSTENWNRSEKEVSYLMRLLEEALQTNFSAKKKEIDDLKIQVRVIGQKKRLPKSLQIAIQTIEKYTAKNSDFVLNIAISYGGRWDIVQAAKKIADEKIPQEKITEELFDAYLSTNSLPNPDLIIRPGGERRLSNFLLWQAAYAELYFCDKYWPDFTEQDLDDALAEYARRQRRFGH